MPNWGYRIRCISAGERAVFLNPNGISPLNSYACSLSVAGRAEEAIPVFQKAIRLSPFGPSFLYRDFGWALRNLGRYEEAVSAYRKAIQIAPDDMLAHLYLTGAYMMMGREKEARAEAGEVLRINPKFSLDKYANIIPYKDQSEKNRVINALWKAGLK
jgi:adenylate cyclase